MKVYKAIIYMGGGQGPQLFGGGQGPKEMGLR